MTRLAVFDCDGTLIDSQASICAAMARTFADAGLARPADAAVRRHVGLSLFELMAALLPEADGALHAQLAARYRRVFHAMRGEGGVAEPLYNGIAPVLATLSQRGWLLGVATGKSDRGLALALAAHGLTDAFVTLQTADRHPSKPDPAMLRAAIAQAGVTVEATAMIGDTSYDMAMARAAGVRAIGVDWGYHPARDLRAAGAKVVAGHPRDLIDHLEAA